MIGSTAISLGVLLATFMGGLCLGSLALPRILSARKEHPLRVYAKVEFGIAICGVLVLVRDAAARQRLHRGRGSRMPGDPVARRACARCACCRRRS